MKKQLGRNDPCWCGSGKKYKKCHLGRDKQTPINIWDAAKEIRKAFSEKDCLVPLALKTRCEGKIVNAHTVPKRGSLKRIASNGHIYSFVPSFETLLKNQGEFVPELVGINKASVFTGFCARHDKEIFSEIEDMPFIGSKEQCHLLAYRAVVRELFTKKASTSLADLRSELDRGRPLEDQFFIQSFNYYHGLGLSAGLKNINRHKERYDQALLTRNFEEIRAFIVEMDCPPPVMCSGGIYPECDFDGNELQDLSHLETIPDLICFTSFYGGNCGEIVFTWLAESDKSCNHFINSFARIPEDRITSALIRFFFEFCENVHFNPDWWDRLTAENRKAIISRMNASANPMQWRDHTCLIDDGLKFDHWPITKTKAIGFSFSSNP